jgi:hypothetical protein
MSVLVHDGRGHVEDVVAAVDSLVEGGRGLHNSNPKEDILSAFDKKHTLWPKEYLPASHLKVRLEKLEGRARLCRHGLQEIVALLIAERSHSPSYMIA